MALTDALSVACKALGFAADTYWGADGQTKYDRQQNTSNQQTQQPPVCKVCGKPIQGAKDDNGIFRNPWEVQEMCRGACVPCFLAGQNK
jgi:formamidopyrimidine-DNA glycosylase